MSALPSRQLAAGARGRSFVALPAAILLAGCGGGGSTAATSQTAAQSGPTSVAAGKAPARGGPGTGGTGAKGTHDRAPRSTASSGAARASATARKASAPASTHRAAPPSGERLLRRFAGSGDTRLGTVVVRSAEELVWQAGHAPIQIFAANGFMLVNSQAPHGSIRLSRGTYRGVRVATHARWSIELRSRS